MTNISARYGFDVETLYGDDSHIDTPAIQTLFGGGSVYDARIHQFISAPNLKALPPGLYRLRDLPPCQNVKSLSM